MSSFRILSIDGGGIRGIYTAVLINRIMKEVPDLLGETIFFAGTNTGSMLAMGMAYGIPPVEMIEIFRAFSKEVLEVNSMRRMGQVVGAKFDIMNVRKILTPYLGAAVLDDYLAFKKKFVLIPTFNLDGMINGIRTWKPKFFHNFPGPDSDAGEMVVDVILRSSATPVYFASYQGYIDGSIVARNPSMAALAQALNQEAGRQTIENVRLLSFGTGYYPRYMGSRKKDWGFSRWAWPLMSLMTDSDMGVDHYYCKQILGDLRYHRLAPLLPEPVGLYDPEAIPVLLKQAEEVDIEQTVEWITNHYLEQVDGENGQGAPEGTRIKIGKSELTINN